MELDRMPEQKTDFNSAVLKAVHSRPGQQIGKAIMDNSQKKKEQKA